MSDTVRVSGRELVKASFRTLNKDKSLLLLPMLGGIFGSITSAIMLGVGLGTGLLNEFVEAGGQSVPNSPLGYFYLFATMYVLTVVVVFFQSALIAGANQRFDGGNPTLGSSLGAAVKKLPKILLWALVATTVGLLLRVLTDSKSPVAKVAGFLGDIAWAIATYFVLPFVIIEGASPFAAISASKNMMKARWGTALRANIRYGLTVMFFWLVSFALIGGGIYYIANGDTTNIRASLGLVGVFAGLILMVLLGVYTSALGSYIRVALYRFAKGLPVDGIASETLQAGFVTKG